MTQPRIGYTTHNHSYDPLQWLIAISIWIAGGKPVRLYPKKPSYDENIDGLIIGGGKDIYPALYKFNPKPGYKYDQGRDSVEIEWLKKAESEYIPTLGICRGTQLMNVTRGGSLHVDVSKVYQNAQYPANILARIFFRKDMNIECGSMLEKILNTSRISVNSMHTQAIDKIGQNLVTSATEDNGVVQCIEDPGRAFFIGVQFHPEALIHKKSFRDIFSALIYAARDRYTS